MYDTKSSRWQAIQRRDQAASASFVYAVISTKIYCRPACPARLARRANVCFYDTPQEAADAGYRPCLRCKPDQALFTDGQKAQRDAVRRACVYIEETKGQVKFADVAKHVGLSTRYLYGLFKAIMATTPAKYAAGLKPEHSEKENSETPSVIWGAVSPEGDGFVDPMLDTVSWDALLDFDCTDFAMMYGLPELSSQYSNTFSDASMVTLGKTHDKYASDSHREGSEQNKQPASILRDSKNLGPMPDPELG